MSKARMDWIKANWPDLQPTGSLILRRALQHYQYHLEQLVTDPEQAISEGYSLKACATGDAVPWKTQPDFTSNPTKALSDWRKETYQAQLEAMYHTDYFERMAASKYKPYEPTHNANK